MSTSLAKLADALLTAFDEVANSNSHLLEAPMAEGTLQQRFLRFVPSRAFKRALCDSDLQRDWLNYYELDHEFKRRPRPGGFYKGGRIEFLEVLNAAAFSLQLQNLLHSGPSFYNKRLAAERAGSIVEQFLNDFPVDGDQVQVVRPDFLFSHDYLEREDGRPENPRALCFFDGCGCDHCWTWLSRGRLLVLLLNGSS